MEENKKLKEDYLRAFADAENTKKRCQQEIEKNNKYAIASFAKSLYLFIKSSAVPLNFPAGETLSNLKFKE